MELKSTEDEIEARHLIKLVLNRIAACRCILMCVCVCVFDGLGEPKAKLSISLIEPIVPETIQRDFTGRSLNANSIICDDIDNQRKTSEKVHSVTGFN